MQFPKSTLLPVVGMIILAAFIVTSYVHGAFFLDQILICSFILSVVFIAKMRNGTHQPIPNNERRTNGTRSK